MREPVGRLTRRAALLGLVAAAVSLVAGALVGHAGAGLAFGAGLAIGSVNAELVRRTVGIGVGFTVLSLARLAAFTLLAVIAGFAFGFDAVWLIVLGLGVSQLLMAALALREVVAR
jgi:hypothetical protein